MVCMKITWLNKQKINPYILKKGKSIEASIDRWDDKQNKMVHERVLGDYLDDLEIDTIAVFYAEDWEGCEKGYGGFFFGKRKKG